MIHAFLSAGLALALLLATPGAAQAQTSGGNGNDITVQVTRDGNAFAVTGEWVVAASVDEVWDVLTDYEHMTTFLTSVDQSHVTTREGNRLELSQKSHGTMGPIRLSADSLRQVELTPKREIRTHLLKGDLKSSDFTTRIAPQGDSTRVSVSGKFVTGLLAGSAITPEAVQAQTQLQYQELREEILRRKNRQPTPACLLAKNCVRG
jgi:carbon monoxide dehydrogenase subunit G